MQEAGTSTPTFDRHKHYLSLLLLPQEETRWHPMKTKTTTTISSLLLFHDDHAQLSTITSTKSTSRCCYFTRRACIATPDATGKTTTMTFNLLQAPSSLLLRIHENYSQQHTSTNDNLHKVCLLLLLLHGEHAPRH